MDERRQPRFWTALAVAFLGVAGLASWFAPSGNWYNQVFDVRLWEEADPGGQYVADAHRLFSHPREPVYTSSHPGTTLELLLNAVQQLVHLAGRLSGSPLGFTAFVARHVTETFFFSKLLMTALHVLSFYLVFRFARALGLKETGARMAALAYATSFPVLFYLSRISVEPLVILGLTGAFLALWRSLDAAATGAACRWAALSAFCAGSGVATKFNLLAPLPACLLLVLATASARGDESRRSPGQRAGASATFLAVATATVGAFSALTNWREFFAAWKHVTRVLADTSARFDLWQAMKDLLPACTYNGAFFLFEALFLAAAALGAVLWLRAASPGPSRPLRRRLFWPAAFGAWGVALWLYRGWLLKGDFSGFHYFFMAMVSLSVLTGYAAQRLLEAPAMQSRRAGAGTCALLLLAVHGGATVAVADSRWQDIHRYRDFGFSASPRSLAEALDSAGAGRVGIVSNRKVDLRMGLMKDALKSDVKNELVEACAENFRIATWGAGSTIDGIAAQFAGEGVTFVLDDLEGDALATGALEGWRAWRLAHPPRSPEAGR